MRVVSYSLLASAAALASVGLALAADLPMRKATPVEYIRVCATHGEGFFYVPGTDTCLRIGGRVRAEYRYSEPLWDVPGNGRAKDAIGFRALARLNIDARTDTAYGTLRAFFRYELTANTGVYGASTAILDKGFIQFAGMTAGVAQSFFDFYANELNWGGSYGSDAGQTNLLAYTATFGSGFSATLAVEDRNQRLTDANYVNGVGAAVPALNPAGERVPDGVAALRVDQSWGAAQLSGAVHQLNSVYLGPAGNRVDTEYGFAVQGAAQVNLPALAPGDQLWVQAAYADGAIGYLGVGPTTIGPVSGFLTDGVVVGDTVKRTQGWGVTAAFLHYWTPSVRQALFGNYTAVDYSATATAQTGFGDFKVWSVGSNVIWSPEKDFDIGVEVLYTKLDPRGRVLVAPGVTRSSADAIEARIRFQRDF
ncbi:porin [Chelatococcus sp. SYSU_G07232]|uniref:Porin n=1 Tax=Chelatococcus albus TaxID=3047466 RepID=A0ABT7AJX4_9HYPH|nr:porin [Chelatococcus sp. SYSU_G07232]MDJ1159662.1 porin [Chelatococcus sp. SYSU_G07232]